MGSIPGRATIDFSPHYVYAHTLLNGEETLKHYEKIGMS